MKEMLIFKPLLKSFFDLTFSILQYQFIFQEQQLLLCLRCKIENYQTNKKSKIRIILYRMKKKNIHYYNSFILSEINSNGLFEYVTIIKTLFHQIINICFQIINICLLTFGVQFIFEVMKTLSSAFI